MTTLPLNCEVLITCYHNTNNIYVLYSYSYKLYSTMSSGSKVYWRSTNMTLHCTALHCTAIRQCTEGQSIWHWYQYAFTVVNLHSLGPLRPRVTLLTITYALVWTDNLNIIHASRKWSSRVATVTKMDHPLNVLHIEYLYLHINVHFGIYKGLPVVLKHWKR